MLVSAIVAFVGCSKEQSSFNVEDIPGSATIEGTLTYDAGYRKISGSSNSYYNWEQYEEEAANVRVTVKIANSQLSNHGASDGYATYETKTNYEGKFSLNVPALDKGTSVTISATPFYADYHERKQDGGDYYVSSERVLFGRSSTNRTVYPNDVAQWKVKLTKASTN